MNPNNCNTCRFKPDPDGVGWCYMFEHEPTFVCRQHSGWRPGGCASLADTIEEFLRQPPPCVHPPSELELVNEYQRYIGGHQVYIYRCNCCGQEVERETPNRLVRSKLREPWNEDQDPADDDPSA